jgi:biotin-(acetyl-CoA carboxylase) ligase
MPEATALAEHGEAPPLRALAEALAQAFVAQADALALEGPASTLAQLRPVCVTLGRKVAWEKGSGVAVDVAEDGALVVEKVDGARERIVAGDVRITQS